MAQLGLISVLFYHCSLCMTLLTQPRVTSYHTSLSLSRTSLGASSTLLLTGGHFSRSWTSVESVCSLFTRWLTTSSVVENECVHCETFTPVIALCITVTTTLYLCFDQLVLTSHTLNAFADAANMWKWSSIWLSWWGLFGVILMLCYSHRSYQLHRCIMAKWIQSLVRAREGEFCLVSSRTLARWAYALLSLQPHPCWLAVAGLYPRHRSTTLNRFELLCLVLFTC